MPPVWPSQPMPFNVTGNPALSMPTGFSSAGLPLGMQIVGRPFADAAVLRIGHAFEAATGLCTRRPEIAHTATAA
jgi:aspartyl-tRNA(Asn)/glutamyl-tRNA(Gln) amidotransferase subunit A